MSTRASFLSNSSVQGGGGSNKSSFQFMTPKEKAKFEEFEQFRAAFAKAKVSRIARAKEDLSTKDPVPFLNKAYYKEWGAKEEKSDMPPYLQAIVKLQDKTGKWFPSKDLYSSLGGAIPDPPEGISPWRWCCALVMAFMRRHPEHIDELRESYKKGLEWTEPRIIEYAREALPPLDPYYDLDETLVKKGKWKDSVSRSYELGGYQNFIPLSLQNKRENAEKEMKEAIEMERKIKEYGEEEKRLKAVGAQLNDKKIRAAYRKEEREKMEQDRMRQRRFNKNEDKRQPLLGVEFKKLAKTKNFTELKKRWEATCSMDDEMNRLKIVKKEENRRRPWDGSIPAVEHSAAKRKPIGHNPKSSSKIITGPSPLAIAAKERAAVRIQERQNRNKKPISQLKKAIMDSEKNSNKYRFEAAETQSNLKRALDQAQANVVSKIIEYESYSADLRRTLEGAIAAYRKARVVAARQTSFDKLTAMLGTPREARMGYNDWRGQFIKGIVLITVELIESVGIWREASLAGQGKLRSRNEFGELVDHGPPMPFTWNGKNILLQIPSGLNFLSRCDELVRWFGNDFTFHRNPFMLAVPLDDRPVTPMKATRTVMIDGVEVEKAIPSLQKEAEEQRLYFEHCEKIYADGGKWWPSEGGKAMDDSLTRRVRSAEKVLVLEEALHSVLS